MQESTLQITRYCVIAEIVVFNIVGVFGNVQLLWTTIRKKATHTRTGILLAVNAFLHLICLLSELFFNAAVSVVGLTLTRRQCFPLLAVYIVTICAQVVVMLGQAVDLFMALLFPLWYRTSSTRTFVTFVAMLAMAYGLTLSTLGWITRDDEVLPLCNPPLVLTPLIGRIWSLSNIVINCLIVAVYAGILSFLLLKSNSRACKENDKAVRRLTVIVIVFICSWFVTILGVDLGHAVGFSPDFMDIWHSNLVLFALLCYSQAFYVCIWRSVEYRAAFMEQLSIMMCRKKQAASHLVSRTTTARCPANFCDNL
ncbi:hypothetical protein Q1695_005732 [Nippostrongylus brasiliensis]|nr:hypothetical protein Q1695_005732 [Nippostrongylus brasiliensis]